MENRNNTGDPKVNDATVGQKKHGYRVPPQDVDDSAISFKNADLKNEDVKEDEIDENDIPPLGVGDEDR